MSINEIKEYLKDTHIEAHLETLIITPEDVSYESILNYIEEGQTPKEAFMSAATDYCDSLIYNTDYIELV